MRELGLPVSLFLLGSYAKGLSDAYSDLDLVVLPPFKKAEVEDRVLEVAFS
ncbi:MAG: hypothetical protein D6804_04435 [Aquificota bacterium]|nr:MAG: hypothetical protein D6804_04435 [Aquificota bacterium]